MKSSLVITAILLLALFVFTVRLAGAETLQGEVAQMDTEQPRQLTDAELTAIVNGEFQRRPVGYFLTAEQNASIEEGVSAYLHASVEEKQRAVPQPPQYGTFDPLTGRIDLFPPKLSSTSNNLSAIGIRMNRPSMVVTYVDPASDLYGKLHNGDQVISIDHVNPHQSWMQQRNFGNEDTLVDVSWIGAYAQTHTARVHRKPISVFVPWLQEGLLTTR